MSRKQGGFTVMIPQNGKSFDDLVIGFHENALKKFAKNLIALDNKIYITRDPNRFIFIKKVTKKIISSIGMFDLTRRYYYDSLMNEYVFLLDNQLGIAKNSSITNELRIKILRYAAKMSYREVGEKVCSNYIFSKTSIYRIIKDTIITDVPENFGIYKKPLSIVHVQIDEKYEPINKKNKYKRNEKRKDDGERKLRYITATIFAGKKNGRLLNRTILSAFTRKELIDKINFLLVNRYKQTSNDTIYLSGDLAKYIRESTYLICPCKAIYIPDMWHVLRYMNTTEVNISKKMLLEHPDDVFKKYLIEFTDEIKSVYRLYKEDHDCFNKWLLPGYLGCSQECMNSHYYCPRFAKVANRFSKRNFAKLITAIESEANNTKIVISSKKFKVPESINYLPFEAYEDVQKYSLDTRDMKYDTYKMFNKIKYGY